MVEYFSLRRIDQRFIFWYHWRAINTALVCSISLNKSQQNHSHLMIIVSGHFHIYYFVQISSIKTGRGVVGDLSLRRIQRRFIFCYHWRDIYTALVYSIILNTVQQNHSHLMILFSNHHNLYFFCMSPISNQVEKRLKICNYSESSEDFHFVIIGYLSIHCWYVL